MTGAGGAAVAPPPDEVRDLAETCVRFVERAVGVKLDYQAETLPLLDHYLEQGRAAAAARPETIPLLAHAMGAYLGEVVRRRYAAWWRIEGDDPTYWNLNFEQVYLSFSPVQLVWEALTREPREGDAEGEGEGAAARFELDEEDREAVAARLAELPQVSEEEYFAPSTRLEVIDIVVDAIRARRMAADEADALLRPEDYER